MKIDNIAIDRITGSVGGDNNAASENRRITDGHSWDLLCEAVTRLF
jgi:hypothetical protein